MRYLFIYLFIIVSCNGQQKVLNNQVNTKEYFVYKIETVSNYYIIYAKKEDSIFKIVSKKESITECNSIKINNNYNFDLYSQSSVTLITGEIIAPVSIYDVVCHTFENDIKICTDRKNGIYDLFYSRNLKGLCIE